MKELESIRQSFQTYCQWKRRHDANKEMYYGLSESKQEQVAEEVVKQLQERIKTDKCCRAMLGTFVPALAEIDISAMAYGTSSTIQDRVATPALSPQQS